MKKPGLDMTGLFGGSIPAGRKKLRPQAGYAAASSMVSMKMPYPRVGSFTSTCVTAFMPTGDYCFMGIFG